MIKEGAKETCFGNWIDKGEDGADRNVHLKQQVAPCNELGCPSKIFGLATTGLFICHTCRWMGEAFNQTALLSHRWTGNIWRMDAQQRKIPGGLNLKRPQIYCKGDCERCLF